MQGQLANSVVGTPELVDGAVTHEKLADGAVSIAKLDVDAVAVITASAARGARVLGEIDETGRVVRGSGFTATRLGPGEYSVRFSKPFAEPPVVVATAQQYALCYLPSATIGVQDVRIKCMTDLLGSSPSAMNTRFSFYAAAAN